MLLSILIFDVLRKPLEVALIFIAIVYDLARVMPFQGKGHLETLVPDVENFFKGESVIVRIRVHLWIVPRN